MHYAGVLLGLEQPQTQTTEAERSLLCEHVPEKKVLVEVGVFEGFTTRLLAEAADHDAIVYGVDPFFAGRIGISWGLRIATAVNRKHLANGRLRFVRALSTEVGSSIPDTVDFVFIDADHSLDGISADWMFWSKRCRPGGVIALHDTIPCARDDGKPELGSHRYFRSAISRDDRFDLVASADSLSVLMKRRGAAQTVPNRGSMLTKDHS